jgi:toxin ParE1/3/4
VAGLIWSDRALDELEAIAMHVALHSPFHAKQVSKRAFLRAAYLPDQPRQGRRLPEYVGPREIREVFVHRWRLIYEVTESGVTILSIIHGARLIENAPPI